MGRSKEIVGRGARGQNAFGSVCPVAERAEDGNWAALGELRPQFPPDGTVELRGVSVSTMKEGDWFIFGVAPNDRHRAHAKFKAVHARKLARLIDLPDGESPESRRRLLVEIGLETGTAGDWAVRIAPDEVVRVTLARAPDGRWRAIGKGLASLPVRRYDPSLFVTVPTEAGDLVLFDIDAAQQLGRAINWSSDAEYLRAVCAALTSESLQEAKQALAALARRAGGGHGVSAAGHTNPAILDDAIRSDAIAATLKADAASLGHFLKALAAQPEVNETLRKLAAERAKEEIPMLEAAAWDKVKAEWEAERASRLEQARKAAEDLEAEELAKLQTKLQTALAEVEKQSASAKELALTAIETEAAERRQRIEAETQLLDERLSTARSKVHDAEVERECLAQAVEHLRAGEQELEEKVRQLRQEDLHLARRVRGAVGHPDFSASDTETALRLGQVETAARKLGVLSEKGVEALVKLSVLFAAGEVPVLLGKGASDLVEIAGALLAGGRLTRLQCDPTLVTYDDLWSRPNGAGLTAFGAASSWSADTGRPVLGFLADADLSGLRFWYPALADARRRGTLPAGLLACVTLDDSKSVEAEALPYDTPFLQVSEILGSKAASLLPSAFELLAANPLALDPTPPQVDSTETALRLMKLGDLSVRAALRLSRILACARSAWGEQRMSSFADEIVLRLSVANTSEDNIVSLAAHA